MTNFDFLYLLPALGTILAMARIFRFLAQLLVRRPSPRPTVIHGLWILVLFIFTMQSWYFLLEWREADVLRHLWQYPLLFLFPFCQYVCAVVLCPLPAEPGFRRLDNQLARHGRILYPAIGLMIFAAGLESDFVTLRAGVELKYPSENVARYIWGLAMAALGLLPAGPRRELSAVALLALVEVWMVAMSYWPI